MGLFSVAKPMMTEVRKKRNEIKMKEIEIKMR